MDIATITQRYDHHVTLRIGDLTLIAFKRKPFTHVEHPFLLYVLAKDSSVVARIRSDDPDFSISSLNFETRSV